MPSRLSGTSWHVGYLKSNDERRHKARCVYHNAGRCKVRGKCIGSSHCVRYKEDESKRVRNKKTIENRKINSNNIKEKPLAKDAIRIGSKIVLEDLEDKDILNLQIVNLGEEDLEKGKISKTSPIAIEAMGKKKGDRITIHRETSYESSFRIKKVDNRE